MREQDQSFKAVVNKYGEFINTYGWSSYTLQCIKHIKPVLDYLKHRANIRNMIDLGCGYKVLTCIIAEYLGVEEVYGVDIDESRLEVKVPCLIQTVNSDITKPLTILHGKKFDLITSFGVIEHIADWDAVFSNINSLSRNGTYLILSAPNLGSWLNRIALLLGFQPRDLEISSKKLYHVLPFYRGHLPAGHLKVATYGAMKELLEDHGFRILKVIPLYAKDNKIANIVDSISKLIPSIARRYIILAQKRS